MMNSLAHGKDISAVEITHISSHGIWLLAHEEVSQRHFYWQQIDVDLTMEMIKHPERFPLVAN